MRRRSLLVNAKHLKVILFFPDIYSMVGRSLTDQLLLYKMLPDETRLERISHSLKITHIEVTRCIKILANNEDIQAISESNFIAFVVKNITQEIIDKVVQRYIENVLIVRPRKVGT